MKNKQSSQSYQDGPAHQERQKFYSKSQIHHVDDDAGDGEDPEGGGAGRQRAGLLHLPQVILISSITINRFNNAVVDGCRTAS